MAVLDKGAEDAAGSQLEPRIEFPSARDSWTMLNGMSGIPNHQATPSMFYLHMGNLLSMDVGFYLDVYLDHNWNG